MQVDQSRLIIEFDGEGDVAEGEANFTFKKSFKTFQNNNIY